MSTPMYYQIKCVNELLCSHNKPVDSCCSFSECDYYTIKVDKRDMIPAYKDGDDTNVYKYCKTYKSKPKAVLRNTGFYVKCRTCEFESFILNKDIRGIAESMRCKDLCESVIVYLEDTFTDK